LVKILEDSSFCVHVMSRAILTRANNTTNDCGQQSGEGLCSNYVEHKKYYLHMYYGWLKFVHSKDMHNHLVDYLYLSINLRWKTIDLVILVFVIDHKLDQQVIKTCYPFLK